MDVSTTDYKVPKKGQIYQSYSELKSAIEQYEKANYVQTWRRDARKVETQQKRAPKKQ